MKQARADHGPESVQLRSRFAEVDVNPRDVVLFPDGLPGYEGTRAFVVLDNPETAPLKILHAVDAAEPCFLTVDPKTVLPSYRCELGAADRLRLGADDESALLWLAIVMADERGDLSVNLRAPIVINPTSMIGRQVMPNNCVYPLHHAIARRGAPGTER